MENKFILSALKWFVENLVISIFFTILITGLLLAHKWLWNYFFKSRKIVKILSIHNNRIRQHFDFQISVPSARPPKTPQIVL